MSQTKPVNTEMDREENRPKNSRARQGSTYVWQTRVQLLPLVFGERILRPILFSSDPDATKVFQTRIFLFSFNCQVNLIYY